MTTAGWSDGFITKLSSDGELLWAKQFGGEDFDLAMDMKVLPSGDLYLVGNFGETADFDPDANTTYNLTTPLESGFLLHLNEQGNLITAVKIGTATEGVYPMAVDVDNNGAAYLTGYFGGELSLGSVNGIDTTFSAPNVYTGFVLKVNNNETLSWATQLTGEAATVAYVVAVNTLGEILVSGFYGGSIQLGATLLTMESENVMESFLGKLDASGHFIAAYRFGGINYIDKSAMGIDAQNNIYLSASFELNVDLDPTPETTTYAMSEGFRDNFLIKMSDSELSLTNFGNTRSILQVYPNPTVGQVVFKSGSTLVGQSYQIVDFSGRIVMTGKFNPMQQIDLSKLLGGVYIAKVGSLKCKVIKH